MERYFINLIQKNLILVLKMTSLENESGFLNTESIVVRDMFANYCVNEEAVPWKTRI